MLQSQIMHKVKVIETTSLNGKWDKKRINQLNVLWAEVLKRNHSLQLQAKQNEVDCESWRRTAAETIKLRI